MPPVGVVARAFRVLRTFDERHPRLTLSEVSRRSGLPVNTVLRTLRSLVAERALERGDDGRYAIGIGMWEIATLATRGAALRSVASPYLRDLQELSGQHALLLVRDGDEAVLMERASPRGGDDRPAYRVGGRVPLATTGGGLALLAFAPADVQQRALAAAAGGSRVEGVDGSGDLARLLATTRSVGVALAATGPPDDRVSIAAPIRDRGGVVAALSLVLDGGPDAGRPYAHALVACARAIERQLKR